MKPLKYSHIIWDWNGTLLDDVDRNLEVINVMLNRRGLPAVGSVEAYRSLFRFPVVEYYRDAGFDLEAEPFDSLAVEYTELYYGGGNPRLFPGTERVLRTARERGARQIILSASKTENLRAQVGAFGIAGYFDEILGISDIYAEGKLSAARNYAARFPGEKMLLIGDTAHDFEVAEPISADCVLISNGHQPREALLSLGVPVLKDIEKILKFI